MKKSQILALAVIGLSLGACSSSGKKDTFMTYSDLQGKVLSHDEQLQSIQVNLEKLDKLEAKVATLEADALALESNIAVLEADVVDLKQDRLDRIESERMMKEAAEEKAAMASEMAMKQKEAAMTKSHNKRQYGVQLASYSNRDEAARGWAILSQDGMHSFNGLTPLVNQIEVNGRTMFQLKVGPFVSQSSSNNFCNALKEKGKDCYVNRYTGQAL